MAKHKQPAGTKAGTKKPAFHESLKKRVTPLNLDIGSLSPEQSFKKVADQMLPGWDQDLSKK